MSATIEKKAKKPAAKKVVKKSAVVPVNGDALKKAIADREKPEKKIYSYGEVWAMRWRVDEDGNASREFLAVPVETEEDIVNYPDKIKALRKSVRDGIRCRGEHWFFSDDLAMIDLLKDLESDTDCIRHDVEYKTDLRENIVDRVWMVHRFIRVLNQLIVERREVKGLVDAGELSEMPKVVPPADKYMISKSLKKFVRRPTIDDIEKELGFKSVDLKDAPAAIQDIAKKLGKVGTVSIATAKLPTKK